MACTLNTISSIDDLSRIRAVLLPHLLDSISDNDHPTTDTDATEDDEVPSEIKLVFHNELQVWFFVASESVARTAAQLSTYGKKKKKSSGSRQQWLRECQLAFSPALNLLVTAFDQQIVVSTGECIFSNSSIKSFSI